MSGLSSAAEDIKGSASAKKLPTCPPGAGGSRQAQQGFRGRASSQKFYFADVHEMAPILKDSDTLTAAETSARSGSASAESAVKAQPVALEIPITVNGARTIEGSDKREPFSESTKTVMVHGSGAVIRLTSAMAPGQLLFLTNERTKKEVVCQVVKSKNYRNVSGYVELEFTEPAVGFWGMRFPGDRIAPGPQTAPAETRTPSSGNGAAAPVPPAAPKTKQPASSAPSINVAKPSAPPVPSIARLATPATEGCSSSIVPPATDSAPLLDNSKAKPNTSVPPPPIATSLGADTPLIEPWLKKREPAARVPAPPARVAPPAPPAKKEERESSLTPVRSFAVERPSDKPASLFAPAEAPANLSSVNLSSIARFFEVKPAVADGPTAAPKAPAATDPELEELKQHTARLQGELAKMQFAEAGAISPPKAEARKPKAEKAEAEKPAVQELETPSFPLTEQSIEALKTELVHENAVRLVENPESSNAAPVLPELSKLDEPVKVEPPAAIPALESLEPEEMKIPAWLEPLARNSPAPASTQDLVLREKTKRRAEQPQLREFVAPLATSAEARGAAASRVPQFGSALPFEGVKGERESPRQKLGNGMVLGGIAAGILALAGGWWYMDHRPAGAHGRAAALQAPAGSGASQDAATIPAKEGMLGSALPTHADATPSQTRDAAINSNAPVNAAGKVSSPTPASSAASTSRGGNVVANAETAQPEPVQAVEKKPALGVVHLAAPKISQKRNVPAGTAPDAGILSEEQPGAGADADSLGGLAVANNQPTAPAAPVTVGGDVKQAKLILSVPPAYPPMAKTQRISGSVTIDALIDANGRVTTMKVISGPALLQEAAKDALKQWKYEPATLDGKAVPMHLSVTIQFRLQQ